MMRQYCSHCILSIYIFFSFISRFGFKSGICLLIAPVPVHCFSIAFLILNPAHIIKGINRSEYDDDEGL